MAYPGTPMLDAPARTLGMALCHGLGNPVAADPRLFALSRLLFLGATPNKHCGDTYRVTTADGKRRDFWERNLRFKTDVSDEGPQKGAPALVGAGMMGDRADVIFASPDEISGSIADQC
jgi:hypothetical protein